MLEYDFTFAELAVKYLETEDLDCLRKIIDLPATHHIMSHAKHFGNAASTSTTLEFVNQFFSPLDRQRKKLSVFKRNLCYAQEVVAKTRHAETTALKYLPKDFRLTGKVFFTFGYDIGVVFGKNCSLNLAHPIFTNDLRQILYYAIHEIHHIGFIAEKGGEMPSFSTLCTRGDMAKVIEYCTHLEGMAVYASLRLREDEGTTGLDNDYISLLSPHVIKEMEKEYFNIYRYFKNRPNCPLSQEDFKKINILSDEKRLWYIVGGYMAKIIDQSHGREKLITLISESSENFISLYYRNKSIMFTL